MEDKFFDRHSPIYETRGNLPHWNQRGKITFITFRLADSIPQDVIKDFIIEEKAWRANHPFPVNGELEEWMRRRHNRIEQYLDSGAGECVLKESECRRVIETTLKFIDGTRCIIHSYVIMPNHIHLLLEPIGEWNIQNIVGSLKKYTAREINIMYKRHGRLWRKEYFDRIIRNETYMNGFRQRE